MAIRPIDAYPGQIDAGDPTGYPYGKARNQSIVGDETGTPLEAAWLSDLWGFQQALLDAGGISAPSGIPDKVGESQYLLALQTLITDAASPLAARIADLESALTTSFVFTRTIPLRAMALVVSSVGSWTITRDNRDYLSGKDQCILYIDLSPYVPRGAQVTKVEASVTTFVMSDTDRMRLSYFTQSFSPTALPTPGIPRTAETASVYADGTAGDQVMTLDLSSTLSQVGHYIAIKASAQSLPAGDSLNAVRITYAKTGL